MAQENYVERCSMQIPPLLEADGFCFWKTHFETYIKSKDIDLWQVIQNGDFVFEIEDSETKMMKVTSYELLKDDEKKQLGMNNEAKMTLYNALPRKEYERVFMCKTAKAVWHTLIITHQGNSQVMDCKIDLLTQQFEKFSISNEETIDSGFTRFNSQGDSHRRIQRLATLPLDELIGNLNVFEMILENDGVAFKTTKEKVKYLALKAKVTREQISDVVIVKEEVMMIWGNRFGNGDNRFERGRDNNFGNKGDESSRQKRGCYNFEEEGHFINKCLKPKENKAFVERAWSDSEEDDEP
ncbi:DUF4219 domain-containing protein [Tanacetum coccineum]